MQTVNAGMFEVLCIKQKKRCYVCLLNNMSLSGLFSQLTQTINLVLNLVFNIGTCGVKCALPAFTALKTQKDPGGYAPSPTHFVEWKFCRYISYGIIPPLVVLTNRLYLISCLQMAVGSNWCFF